MCNENRRKSFNKHNQSLNIFAMNDMSIALLVSAFWCSLAAGVWNLVGEHHSGSISDGVVVSYNGSLRGGFQGCRFRGLA